jgi:hypothetical protein
MKPAAGGAAQGQIRPGVAQCDRETSRSSNFFPLRNCARTPVRLQAAPRPGFRGSLRIPVFWVHLRVWTPRLGVNFSQATLHFMHFVSWFGFKQGSG